MIPGLCVRRPMQRIIGSNRFMWIDMKPAFGYRIPAERQGLQTAVGKLDQILLQGMHAKHIFDGKLFELALFVFGLDTEFLTIAKHARCHAEMLKLLIVEVAQHRFGGG